MINNQFYEELKEGWYCASDHPIALLRAENKIRVPWILDNIPPSSHVLDIGCGAGFLTNACAKKGHTVTGIDLSPSSLHMARQYDETQSVHYVEGNGYSLPFANESFDVVCAMDLLEHVEEPYLVIAEASRVLKTEGLFFFHTFNRNWLSYLLVIKGVDWFVKNAPKNMHVYSLFIKPDELKEVCSHYELQIKELRGFEPIFFSSPFWKMIRTRNVPEDFTFRFSKNLQTGYCGYAQKKVRHHG